MINAWSKPLEMQYKLIFPNPSAAINWHQIGVGRPILFFQFRQLTSTPDKLPFIHGGILEHPSAVYQTPI
jgi:hypothetical protein